MVASKPAGKLKPGVCSSHQGNDTMRAGLVEQSGVMESGECSGDHPVLQLFSAAHGAGECSTVFCASFC